MFFFYPFRRTLSNEEREMLAHQQQQQQLQQQLSSHISQHVPLAGGGGTAAAGTSTLIGGGGVDQSHQYAHYEAGVPARGGKVCRTYVLLRQGSSHDILFLKKNVAKYPTTSKICTEKWLFDLANYLV